MWHFISEQISQQIQYDFVCDDIREISSGDSHKAYRVSDGRKRFFVKINEKSKLSHFKTESDGLEHLRQANQVRLPHVICSGVASEVSFLALEHLVLKEGNTESWQTLGEQLAQLHRVQTDKKYGGHQDNYIGLTPQPNQWHDDWASFFAEQRIGYMLDRLAAQKKLLCDKQLAVDAIYNKLAGHQPKVSMLHGDLWAGNVGFHQQQPVIFDPAFYFGDRETDIAMTELFGRFPTSFYQAYNGSWPLEHSYAERKPIYQLYHILNHGLLFGGSYLNSAKSILAKYTGQ